MENVDGEQYENVKKLLFDYWKSVIPEIKKQSFSREQINYIKLDFIENMQSKIIAEMIFQRYELRTLELELNLALEIAFSNWYKEHKPFWRRKEFKLPNLDFSVIKTQM